jgi:hypothetical protein
MIKMPSRKMHRRKQNKKRSTRKQRAGALVPLHSRAGHVLPADTILMRKNLEYRHNNEWSGPEYTPVYVFEQVAVPSGDLITRKRIPSVPVYVLHHTLAQTMAQLRAASHSDEEANERLYDMKEHALVYVPVNELFIDSNTVTTAAPVTPNDAKRMLGKHLGIHNNGVPRLVASYLPANNGIRRNVTTLRPYMVKNNNNNRPTRVYPPHETNAERREAVAQAREAVIQATVQAHIDDQRAFAVAMGMLEEEANERLEALRERFVTQARERRVLMQAFDDDDFAGNDNEIENAAGVTVGNGNGAGNANGNGNGNGNGAGIVVGNNNGNNSISMFDHIPGRTAAAEVNIENI